MCLGIISGIVSAVGTGVSAAMAARQSRYQAQIAERQARMEQQKGAYDAARQSRANTRQIDAMRSAYLNSGIAVEGSAASVIQDSATEASLDEQAIKYGSQIRADNYRFEANIARMNARSQMIGGAIGALGSVVNGFTQQASMNANRTMIRNPYAA